MQLTSSGDYAIRVIVDLAAQPEGVLVRTDDLRDRTGVPRAYLGKIVQALAHKGLIRTRRGAGGGLALTNQPQSISLKQVIEAVEGPIHLVPCVERRGLCARDGSCAIHPAWARIQKVLIDELSAVRIADLVASGPEPPRGSAGSGGA